jgi:hypothetical protein
MPLERCWHCQQYKSDVTLAATDDRLCRECYVENERQLEEQRALQSAVEGRGNGRTRPISTTEKKSSKKSAKITTTNTAAAVEVATETVEFCHGDGVELNNLRLLVETQQATINKLLKQMEFIMSFLDIKATDFQTPNAMNQPESETACKPQIQATDLDHDAGNHERDWTEVASYRTKRTDTFRQSVVTAVYVDQTIKKRHETSLIVSGLQPTSSQSDSDLFAAICQAEFHILPNVILTKRLGRSDDGKLQPLLVVLKQADEANKLINLAKTLRRSTNAAVRQTVYINPYMTRAEAAATYQLREQRRQSKQRGNTLRTKTGDSSNDGSGVVSAATVGIGSALTSVEAGGSTILPSSDSYSSELNPLADPFSQSSAFPGCAQQNMDTNPTQIALAIKTSRLTACQMDLEISGTSAIAANTVHQRRPASQTQR